MPHEEVSPLYKANTLVTAGLTLLEDGRFDKAISCLDEALGYTADLWYFKGAALRSMKDYKAALACFKTALELNPKHSGSRMDKGVALHYLGKYKQAIATYNEIIASGKDVAHAFFNKACALSLMGKDKEAINCLRKANELDPVNTSINLGTEESFDRLRGTPEFEAIENEIRNSKGDMHPKQNLSYIG